MVVEVSPKVLDPEDRVKQVFLKCIELIGGFKKLAELRGLTWLPAIARASFAVVLKYDFNKTDEEIAEDLGTTKAVIRQILRADPDVVLKKIEEEEKDLKTHIAGGLAKRAYELVKEGGS